MVKNVVGIRFRPVGKIYYMEPNGLVIERGQHVIVETMRGIDAGKCELANRDIDENTLVMPLRNIIRIASKEDIAQMARNKEREAEALEVCAEKVKKHGLEMRLVDVELAFDLTKVVFHFISDGRIDFRELVRDLAAHFRMRIELRQIGVRDEAKILNGIGICGRTLCCATFLPDFQPVSIKMAKDQGMSLNPTKISGVCGRLMCCLKYEEETYEEYGKNMPELGEIVMTPDGKGEVMYVNTLAQNAKVAVHKDDTSDVIINTYAVSDIRMKASKAAGGCGSGGCGSGGCGSGGCGSGGCCGGGCSK